MTEFIDQIKALGPTPVSSEKLAAMERNDVAKTAEE